MQSVEYLRVVQTAPTEEITATPVTTKMRFDPHITSSPSSLIPPLTAALPWEPQHIRKDEKRGKKKKKKGAFFCL